MSRGVGANSGRPWPGRTGTCQSHGASRDKAVLPAAAPQEGGTTTREGHQLTTGGGEGLVGVWTPHGSC